MNNLSFDSKRCELIRQYLDSYLSNELLVETASEVVRHLESCESCSRDLESRMRVRDALQRAVVNRPVPDSVHADVLRSLRESQPRSFMRPSTTRWAIGLASIAFILLSLFAANWMSLRREEQLVASILKLGVSDHIVCAIKGRSGTSSAFGMLFCCRLSRSDSLVLKFWKDISVRYRAATASTFISSREAKERFYL